MRYKSCPKSESGVAKSCTNCVLGWIFGGISVGDVRNTPFLRKKTSENSHRIFPREFFSQSNDDWAISLTSTSPTSPAASAANRRGTEVAGDLGARVGHWFRRPRSHSTASRESLSIFFNSSSGSPSFGRVWTGKSTSDRTGLVAGCWRVAWRCVGLRGWRGVQGRSW